MARCFALILSYIAIFSTIAVAAVPRSANRFDRLGLEDGLSQSVVLAILQDSSGFVWLATQDGLNRYDGYELRIWRHDRNRPDTLSSSHISSLAEDQEGRLWVGTNDGLNLLDPSSGSVTRVDLWPDREESPQDRYIRAVAASSSGDVFVGTETGLLRTYEGVVTAIESESGSLGRIASLNLAADGSMFVGNRHGGLFRVAQGSNQAVSVDLEHDSTGSVWGVAEDAEGRIWVATTGGLIEHEQSTGKSTLRYADESINHLLIDKDGMLWLAFNGRGASVFDPDSGAEIGNFIHDVNDPRTVSADYVNILAEDASGTIWLGTWGGGVCRYSPFRDKFDHHPGGGGPHRLESGGVYALWAESGRVWVGTEQGLELYDRSLKTFDHNPIAEGPLPEGWVYTLLVDDQRRLWVGVYDEGLVMHDQTSGRTVLYRHDENDSATISSNTINRIEFAGANRLWLATTEGLDLFDPDLGVVRHFAVESGLPVAGALTVLVSSSGAVFVGTDGGGLAVLEVGDERFRGVYDKSSVAGVVLCLHEDEDGAIWAGTDGDGLVKFDPGSDAVTVFGEEAGLPNNVIYGICSDDEGGLWVSSNRGLVRFVRSNGAITAYDHRDGLQSNEFNQGAYYKSSDGELFFGGVNGFNHFYPDQVPLNTHLPQVALTHLEIGNEPVQLGMNTSEVPALVLPAAASVSFRFTALDFSDPPRNRYRYQMSGFDPDWVEAGARRFVTYTNLDPGDYSFHVVGSNADGRFNLDGLAITLVIEPPFWQKTWFILLVAIGVTAVLTAGHRFRVNSIQRMKDQLEQEVVERTAELSRTTDELKLVNEKKNLLLGVATHEMRQPLNIINGWVDIVLSRLNTDRFEATEAKKLLKRARKASASMQALIEDLLDLSAIESGKVELRLNPATMDSVLKECIEVHQQDAEQKEISLNYQSQTHPEIEFDHARICEVVDNLISNAIKYTWPGGSVTLWTETREQDVVTHVRDSGQGLSEADLEVLFTEFSTLSAKPTGGEKSTGLGLAIVRKLVHLHGGEVWAESTLGEGSTFSFSIPRC